MKIIIKSRGISKKEMYEIMSPKEYTNMREKAGETLEIDKFVSYQEPDGFNGSKKVLAIQTTKGEVVISASQSLVAEFEKIVAIFGTSAIDKLDIMEEETGGGYDVLTCRLSSMEV